ncbi:MAG: hypothetical protein ACRDPA_18870 [Solirubrobacteraceae bacterium]
MPRRFALDQNFPRPIVETLREFMTEAELVSLGDIDERLSELDDWEVLLALRHHEEDWDGLITTDSGMLALPRELSVLMQTKLTLVVAAAAGHDPLKATGLVLTYLPWIAAHTQRDMAQVWVLRSGNKPHGDPWETLERVAQRHGRTAQELYAEAKLSEAEFAQNPLA